METILAPVVGAGFGLSMYIFSMSVACAIRIGTSKLSPVPFSVVLGKLTEARQPPVNSLGVRRAPETREPSK